jgi:hypothetical protein
VCTLQEARVDELIAKLGLSDVANSIIGKEGRRGVSGGKLHALNCHLNLCYIKTTTKYQ